MRGTGAGRRWGVAAALAGCVAAGTAEAADLPPHEVVRILVVGDDVNPHGLPPAQITQLVDLTAALRRADNGILTDPAADGVREVPTNQIEVATALLSVPPGDPAAYDVLVYFAHRIPDNGNDAAGRQAAFTAAVTAFLQNGGGVVSFHHGSYFTGGKEGIIGVIGAQATGFPPWNTVDGQDVIDVAPGHFVTTNGVEYAGTTSYADAARGIPFDDYPVFNNTPDERYPNLSPIPGAGTMEMLFASDYNEGGTTHVLGFTHRRPGWTGMVVAYQPGEYQPNALDDVNGNNFQILANAVVHSTDALFLNLTARRGAGPEEVVLDWTGGHPTFTVYRSTDPATLVGPGNVLGSTPGRTWSDTPPPGIVFFYAIEGT